jgi:hypothetical protein
VAVVCVPCVSLNSGDRTNRPNQFSTISSFTAFWASSNIVLHTHAAHSFSDVRSYSAPERTRGKLKHTHDTPQLCWYVRAGCPELALDGLHHVTVDVDLHHRTLQDP